MRIRNLLNRQLTIIVILSAALLGCGGGGGDKSPPSDPVVQVLPADSYSFGTVTTGNTPAPLEIKINSIGATNLTVSSIALSGDNVFSLNLNPESNPCGSSATISPGDTCSFEVAFHPTVAGAFSAIVRIATNDVTYTVHIEGASEDVSALTVRINQVVSECPANTWTAYVSVTDQEGYPYAGLVVGDFDVNLGGAIDSVTCLADDPDYQPISIVAALDYSSSITDNPEIVNDMEEGIVDLINQMGDTDSAEIIKFGSDFDVVQAFTSNKALLRTAVQAPLDLGVDTLLWDTLYQAVEDAGARAGRRAVIVLTDGYDSGQSAHSLEDVIGLAQSLEVPIFPVALGTNLSETDLGHMWADTGGQLYRASASDNLRNVYVQLASLLFQNQYIVEFHGINTGVTGSLTVTVDAPALDPATDTTDIALCSS